MYQVIEMSERKARRRTQILSEKQAIYEKIKSEIDSQSHLVLAKTKQEKNMALKERQIFSDPKMWQYRLN